MAKIGKPQRIRHIEKVPAKDPVVPVKEPTPVQEPATPIKEPVPV